jgi:GxxExxY protein
MPERSKPESAMGAEINCLTERMMAAAIDIHRRRGPGPLESAYEQCLGDEVSRARIRSARRAPLPIRGRGLLLDCSYGLGRLAEDAGHGGVKSMEIHSAQLSADRKAAYKPIGPFSNCSIPMRKNGRRRLANRFREAPQPIIGASSRFDAVQEVEAESLSSALCLARRLGVSAVDPVNAPDRSPH